MADEIEDEPKYKFSQIGDYIVGKTLGQGSFGKVKLGIHSVTKKKVKILCKSKAKYSFGPP
jgi:5'-AMP-activated protein kinase catalytic alpha subunit